MCQLRNPCRQRVCQRSSQQIWRPSKARRMAASPPPIRSATPAALFSGPHAVCRPPHAARRTPLSRPSFARQLIAVGLGGWDVACGRHQTGVASRADTVKNAAARRSVTLLAASVNGGLWDSWCPPLLLLLLGH